MERLEEARAIMAHLPLSQSCGAQPVNRDQPSARFPPNGADPNEERERQVWGRKSHSGRNLIGR